MKVWTRLSESDLYDVAAEVGVAIAIHQTSTENRNGSGIRRYPLPRVGRAFWFGLRPLKSLGKRDSGYKYQRTSASVFSEGRRVFAVCWHGHRDFMLAIYARDPEARIKTYWAAYRGVEDFRDKFPETAYKNVGSLMYPAFAKDICTCSWGDWDVDSGIGGSYGVTMQQSMIQACPHYIFMPDHYRADGSCKCNDPHDSNMKEWGYTWKEGAWVA